MVESKTQKRKAAARAVARASHENSKLKATKKAEAAVSRNQKSSDDMDDEKPGAKLAQDLKKAVLSKSKGNVDIPTVDDDKSEDEIPIPEDDSGDDDISGDDEDDFSSQRLVVRLTPANEKKLEAGLKKIKGNTEHRSEPAEDKNASSRKAATKQISRSILKDCVVYLGRIPFGFFEKEMRAYFSQFGEVLRLRLARNKKTSKSKHYAFIEFDHPEVAQIVAETHNNMLMCDRVIKCSVVPPEKVHPKMFMGAGKAPRKSLNKKVARQAANGKRSRAQELARVEKLLSRERRKRRRLEAAGVAYDFAGYQQLVDAARPRRTKFHDSEA